MTFWCQFSGRIYQGDKSKRRGGVSKPPEKKANRKTSPYLQSIKPKWYLVILWLHDFLFYLYVSQFQFLAGVKWFKWHDLSVVWKNWKERGSTYKWFTLYTKNTENKPSTKSLPFGVIRLQPHLLVGLCWEEQSHQNQGLMRLPY